MAEIIGPDGKTYYSVDHDLLGGKSENNKKSSSSKSAGVGQRKEYGSLILGVLAILIALFLLADIAIGIMLLFFGSTSVNYYLMKKRT